MAVRESWRVRLTIASVLVAGGVSGGFTLGHALYVGSDYRSNDLVLEHENGRLAGLRPVLPRQGVIGYIHDPNGDWESNVRVYYLSQYALNPLILVEDVEPPFVVANYLMPSHRPLPQPGRQLVMPVQRRSPTDPTHSLFLLADVGNGVQCYRAEVASWPH
jgi:hypothetical protein